MLTFNPVLIAIAVGIDSRLSANFLIAYCSSPGHFSP